jgi:hypothetical protein
MDNSSNNNDQHHDENDPEIFLVKNLCQPMQRLHELDVSRNELRKTIVDAFFKESKVMILHFVLFKQMFYE